MALPNNPSATHSGVPQSSQEPAEASLLPVPTGALAMVAPATYPSGTAPLHTDAVSSARSSRSIRGRVAAWMLVVCQSIFPAHGFIPYRFDHLDDYVSWFSGPLLWLWHLMEIAVIVLVMLYIRKGAAIARYATACVILVLSFVVIPIVLVTNDSVWYYTFVSEPGICELGLLGARLLLIWVLDWVCIIATILLAIPDLKPASLPYVMGIPILAARVILAGRVTSPAATSEDVSSKAAPKNPSAQAANVSVSATPQ